MILAAFFVAELRSGYACAAAVDKLTYHNDAQRSGWNREETILTPDSVASAAFGLLWQTPTLDYVEGVPPRLFASPLYVSAVEPLSGPDKGKRLAVVYVISSTAFAYAIKATDTGATPAGSMLWRRRLTGNPCAQGTMGNLSTPVIGKHSQRIYVTSCEEGVGWQAHALDLRDGQEEQGWPVAMDARAINAAGVNHNGTTRFNDQDVHIQRGALNLSGDGAHLYVGFGMDGSSGWLVAIDTRTRQVASAFSSTPVTEQIQGGMWGSGGPSVDRQGRIYVATGASSTQMLRHAGIPGVYPDSAHSWGQSILQLSDSAAGGLQLTGTYTPFNYCVAAANDIDLGSSGTVVVDLDPRQTQTPHLLALGGGKQGNAYLLDRDRMPGGVTQRHPCSEDASSDLSLLSPDKQPQFGARGPLNLFGPYSEQGGSFDQARSRSTAAWYEAANGEDFLFVTGSSKRSVSSSVSIPPGLARLRIVQSQSAPAYLRIDRLETTQTLQNPGSPVVSSHQHEPGIVWVLDANAPRTATVYGPHAPHPVLYAFATSDLRLLWKSAEGLLPPSGKYNEPTVANGVVFVGTDSIQAFGLRPRVSAKIAAGTYRDFELHLEYRVRGSMGSTCLTFRSNDSSGDGGRVVSYQTRLGAADTRDLFAIRRVARQVSTLALMGESTDFYLLEGEPHRKVVSLVNDPHLVASSVRPYPAWNEYVLRVSGNHFAQAINGVLINETSDNDFAGRSDLGELALQPADASAGGVEIRAIRVSNAMPSLALTRRFATHPQIAPTTLTAEQVRVVAAGRDVYRQRCAACHSTPGTGAPPMQSLAQFPEGRITDVLTNGLMRDMATGLADEQKRAVAIFLTTESADTP